MFKFVKRHWAKVTYLAFFFLILLSNTFHEQYTDEFDNILGGKLILQGILPYSGFFSHHGPVAYFLSAIIYLFSGQSFVKFRIIYSIFLFLYSLGIYKYLKRSVGKIETKFYLIFLLIWGIAATYFWNHMLIADNLSALLIVPTIILLILKVLYKKSITRSDLIFVSILSSLALLTALTTAYLVCFVYLFTLYFYLKGIDFKIAKKNIIPFFVIMAIPYVIFALYLLATRSFQDYIYQNIILNEKYYIYNAPISPSGFINPVRYAIVIFHNFYYSFTSLLYQVKDFNFGFPFNITLAISNVALIIYFILRRQYALSIFFLMMLVYSNARSSPLDSSEKDYQDAVYILMSLFSMCFFVIKVFNDFKNEVDYRGKLILSSLFILVGIYSLFTLMFLYGRYQEKVYTKYMGTASLIYDRPELAPIINKALGPNDYVWIGPIDFKDYIYTNAKIASRYQFLIPAMGRSGKVVPELISGLKKNQPKLIFFDKNYSVLGSNPQDYAKLFVEYLNTNYITLYGYENNKYITTVPVSPTVDLETKMYINKADINDVLAKLISVGLVKQASK